jgi:putative SOS response-associated peptidase YedK
MCGRYVIYDQLTKGSVVLFGQTIPVNYNVAPTANVPIIRRNAEDNDLALSIARWGLIPRWAKHLKIPPYFNARADNLPGNKVFWPSINRRCLLPMCGFFEWAEQDKFPYYIFTTDTPLFYTAGLWNQWQSPDGKTIDSCTIITTRPNKTLADIHHRMPVILKPSDFDTWLDAEYEQAKTLLQPTDQPMDKYPVNPKVVNNARNNTVVCLEPWSSEG